MIEYITIDGEETPLSICATTTTRNFSRFSWFRHAQDMTRLGKKYYVTSEKLVFFDDEPAISVAAQLAEWVDTNISKGRQFIYVPGDTLMYCAELHIHSDYVLVDSERLLSFEQSLQQIRQAPSISHIHTSGDLRKLLQQQGFELKDLRIDLTPGSNNPYWLKRGRSFTELTGGMLILLGMVGASTLAFQWFKGSEAVPVLRIMEEVRQTQSSVQLHNELNELVALMSASSVWMNYGLKRITINKSGDDFITRLEGEYQNDYPLPRLRDLAQAIDSQFMIQGDNWFIETPIFKPESGDSHELVDILDSVGHYQRLMKAGYVKLDLGGIREERRHRTANLELRVNRPFPGLLAGIARQVERDNIHGAAQKIDVEVNPGHGWQLLNIDINLLGI